MRKFLVKKKIHHWGKPLVFFFILSLIVSYFILLQLYPPEAPKVAEQIQRPQVSQDSKDPSVDSEFILQPTFTPGRGEPKNYQQRLFRPQDLFYEGETFVTSYPQELLSVGGEDLPPVACSRFFELREGKYRTYNRSAKLYNLLTDPPLISYIKQLNQNYSPSVVVDFLACEIYEGDTILLYKLKQNTQTGSTSLYTAVVKDSQIHEISKIDVSNENLRCNKALQVTKGQYFYFDCTGANGNGAVKVLYQINLKELSLSKVLKCERGVGSGGKKFEHCRK